MKKLLFIFNPLAGKGAIRGHLINILDVLTKDGWLVTAYPTQSKADATRIAAELGGQYDRVVCSGGDGTLSETIAGLRGLDCPPPLGYLPAGTTNDFSKNMHLPKTLEEAAHVAATGPVRKCDIGLFNQTSFIYVAAFGAFTDVPYSTPQEFKSIFGHLAYLLEGVTRLPSLKSYSLNISYDEGTLDGEFIYGMASNTISVGGFRGLTPEVKLDDGLFEVLLIRRPKTLTQLHNIVSALLQQKPTADGEVIALRTTHLQVTAQEPLPWTLDGEFGGDPLVARIENHHQAIELVWGE